MSQHQDPTTDPVIIAVDALRHLYVETRDDAARLLATYARRDALTDEQQRQVLDAFGAPE